MRHRGGEHLKSIIFPCATISSFYSAQRICSLTIDKSEHAGIRTRVTGFEGRKDDPDYPTCPKIVACNVGEGRHSDFKLPLGLAIIEELLFFSHF